MELSRQNKETSPRSKPADEGEIKQLLTDFAAAVEEGDIEKVMSYYAPDLVAFDVPAPLRFVGRERYRASWEKWFAMAFQFPVQFKAQDMQVFVSGDVAFAHEVIHMEGTLKKDSQKVDNWLRHTVGLKATNGRWWIIHDHFSVPLGENGEGLMNLKPGEEESIH